MIKLDLTENQVALVCACIFIGVTAAVIYYYCYKRIFCSFVNALVSEKAFDADSAKTLEQLGGYSEKSVRSFLRTKSPVRIWEKGGRYYIDEAHGAKARALFKKSNPLLIPFGIAATAVFCVALYFAVTEYML